jgi:hypothetical protein
MPAGSPARVRWSGHKDQLNIFLEPGLVARVAAEAFDLDPARLTLPPLDALDLPHLRAAMGLVDAELAAGGAGGPLAAESLANSSLQAARRRHARAVPNSHKNRLNGRKSRRETGWRILDRSVRLVCALPNARGDRPIARWRSLVGFPGRANLELKNLL